MKHFFEPLATWLAENIVIVLLPFVGALVAHLKEYERLATKQTPGWHVYGYFSRAVYAVFAAFLVGAGLDWYYAPGTVPRQLGWIVIGICSVRPDPVINWMFEVLSQFAEKHGLKNHKEKKYDK